MPLMQHAIESALTTWPDAGIQIGAQDYLKAFYQKLGFVACSEMYLEDGIPHLDMRYHSSISGYQYELSTSIINISDQQKLGT